MISFFIFFFSLDLEWLNARKPLSLSQDLANQVVIIDFFTYCCINCLHILPTLKRLEKELKDFQKVSIVGVHSAKFTNDKITAQIKEATLRYSIDHPVVCDRNNQIWDQLNITCWPTILILGPDSRLLFQLVGEFTVNSWLPLYCQVVLNHFYSNDFKSFNWSSLMNLKQSLLSTASRDLKYPGKVEISPNGNLVAIADSGNNRIVITLLDGTVDYLIGSNEDDNFEKAEFNNPQGLAWLTDEILFVADTGNNCVKKIDLINLKVTILVNDRKDESIRLKSPWDLCLVDANKLLIVNAGSHQIAAFCLSNDCRILNTNHDEKSIVWFAGNGQEENRNNLYPLKAGFAQPSGITFSPSHEAVFIADSESSTIRKINLKTGVVKNLVGGNINPMDLFAYGDEDGSGLNVKLQHPLGLAYNHHDQTILLTDTYNQKVSINTD